MLTLCGVTMGNYELLRLTGQCAAIPHVVSLVRGLVELAIGLSERRRGGGPIWHRESLAPGFASCWFLFVRKDRDCNGIAVDADNAGIREPDFDLHC